jgi:cyclopropane fatty-acyl-phospholipid synthase-like methyltransferase
MISAEYKKQIQVMAEGHLFKEKLPKYPYIKDFISAESPQSILDFGCAHGRMMSLIISDFPNISVIEGYDPGVPEYENFPTRTYECLVSNDVIEHIEPKYLDQTLRSMDQLFTKSAWLIVACYPAKKKLPDGRNAHLSVHEPHWWIEKIKETFTTSKIEVAETVEYKPGLPDVHFVLRK